MPIRPLLILFSALLAAVPAGAASKDPEADLKQVQGRIEELQQGRRDDLARRDKLAVELRDAETAVADSRKRLSDVRRRLAESRRRLDDLAAERRRNEQVLNDERDALAAQLKAAYINGSEEQLKLLLSQKDPAALGRMLVYYSYLGKARASKIGEIEAAVQRLEALTKEEAAENARLAGLEGENTRELRLLDDARAGRKQAIAAVNAQIRTRSDTIARLKRQEAGLQKLIEDLRRALQDSSPIEGGQPFERVRGRLPWPVSGRVVAEFGQARGGGLKWSGVMIATARGTEVRAPYTGRIVYADWLPGLGLLLILDHGGGYMSLYGHNEQLFKGVGQAVAPGEVIATVGDTGGQDQPQLYVEVRRGSRVLDPRDWFRRGGP
jgi:septal ring factor EnvC (AmiA/AmiB activator)